jgi:hypothetical protein
VTAWALVALAERGPPAAKWTFSTPTIVAAAQYGPTPSSPMTSKMLAQALRGRRDRATGTAMGAVCAAATLRPCLPSSRYDAPFLQCHDSNFCKRSRSNAGKSGMPAADGALSLRRSRNLGYFTLWGLALSASLFNVSSTTGAGVTPRGTWEVPVGRPPCPRDRWSPVNTAT